jgi:uncharacterized protein (TIGR02265 family)
MRGSLAQMNAYLEGLPRGLDSYPNYLQKASVYRQVFSKKITDRLTPLLPPALGELLVEPLPMSAWFPEVHANALFLALYENFFDDEAAFVADGLASARKIFDTAAYRILMALASPEIIVRRAPSRWEAHHRGLQLTAKMTGKASASLRIGFPLRLLPRVMALAYTGAFQAALEASGGAGARCQLATMGADHVLYEATWR